MSLVGTLAGGWRLKSRREVAPEAGIPSSFLEMGGDVEGPACEAHPSRPRPSSWLEDGHIMPAACQVDIRGRGANVSSIHLNVRTGGRGFGKLVVCGRRTSRPS